MLFRCPITVCCGQSHLRVICGCFPFLGPAALPSEEEVFEAVLARRPGGFMQDPAGSNLLLVAFAHHFLYQFQSAQRAPAALLQLQVQSLKSDFSTTTS